MPGRSKGEALTREQFTGQLRDNEPGFNLDYFKARYYDPAMGRFLSVDPLADQYPGWTPYAYVLNNPLRYNDPTGLCAELINASAGSYEGEAAQNLYQQHCSGTEPEEKHQDPDKKLDKNKPTCIGLNCGDAAAGLLATIEISSSQNTATSSAQRSVGVGLASLGRRSATRAGFFIAGYSLYQDYDNPDVSRSRFAYRATGMALSYGTPIMLGAKYGSAFGPKGTLIGAGVGVAFVSGEYAYDNRHVPRQNIQRQKRDFMFQFNQFIQGLKQGYPIWR